MPTDSSASCPIEGTPASTSTPIEGTRETIGRALEAALKEWGLIRVVTCTVDNALSNDTALGYLKTFLREANKTILGGEYLHVRCAAHILNLIVSDGMKNLHDSIARVRTVVRWVRSSPVRLKKFKVVARSAGITSKKRLCTDLTTQWNSTFFMLEAAQEYKLAFALLDEEDIQYVKYFEHEAGLGKPMTEDWDVVSTFVDFLRFFYEITTILSGSLYPTSHNFCQQICKVKEELDEIIASGHTRLREMTLLMRAKYDKYWGGDFDRANMLLYIAVAIDSRFKVDDMVYGLGIAYGQVWAEHIALSVKETLDRLFDEFTILRGGNITAPTPIPPPVPNTRAKKKCIMDWGDRMKGNPLTRSTTEVKSEIDRYFGLDLEPYVRDFDILAWWKVHAPKYPVLAQIARSILAIPISTVASESAFNTGGRVLDLFQSSLDPATVESLICTSNWIIGSPIHVPDVIDYDHVNAEEEGGDAPGSGNVT
ncbi:zinc finger BED domain-containing protein RICESLEEPER 2-like [Carya illinoinensis]|uniref:zinc finger BED domain-containing protein RICESLEEPER 2-like n=1 Tax=Carya illinoinensis TaxID=32201 RepID=UPI001C72886D|nr:zinc finger BED domain-containing protein RICESLEEPER 2-like [Carya illinoinensis]